ncbi:amino acid ABC transporter permease [Pseudaminobacter sp. 19-2017]|uniref:Amino acid ABC transporter permease n=1 Tax=Pseudaminobacter soli (ex Zhang et al. 2022) TaxID=2831468 RepID=A0A942E2G3_9HYPH|nr:amino acid ABC transporter permease [Pseudaminobacter soli]MBS3649380.1 amino acid ABC transporter permease [Pseudaminobacter soli]
MDAATYVLPALLKGAWISLLVAVQAGALGLAIAVAAGALREMANPILRFAIGLYVEFFRGTSAFIQIYWAYFALPMLGVRLSALEAGTAVLALNIGAYGTEIVRGALKAVPRGQREACHALGLPVWITYVKVLIPQALTRAILPFGNLMVDLLKGTALLSAITVTELTFAGRQAVSSIGHPFLIFGAVLVLYLIMAAPIAWGARAFDRRARRWQTEA